MYYLIQIRIINKLKHQSESELSVRIQPFDTINGEILSLMTCSGKFPP